MSEYERTFQNPECAVNAVHIQALTHSLSFIATLVLLYLISAITLLCIIAFDLAPAALAEQTLLVLSVAGLSPPAVTLILWRFVARIIFWYVSKHAKEHLKHS
jgi:hypothetical protein